MPWGNRPHPDDWTISKAYGKKPCPRCGKPITTNAWGRNAHIKACLKRIVTVGGKKYPPAKTC